jgi:signal peptidase I
MNIIRKLLSGLAIFVLVFSLGFMLFVSFSPVKSVQLLKVMSGSMEPAIKTGSLVLVKATEPSNLKEGDVITYTTNSPLSPITHRVVKVESENNTFKFITKGDANNNSDIDEVSENQVLGKVVTNTPYLGYVSNWTKTPIGFVLLIIIPALFIIINEVFSLRTTVKKEIDKKVQEKSHSNIQGVLIVSIFVSLIGISSTYAYFSDGKVLSGNIFATAETFPQPSITPTPTQAPSNPCGEINVDISGNGAGSINGVFIVCENFVVIEQSNNTSIENNINLNSNTGNNSVTNNTSSTSTIESGSSEVTVIQETNILE